MIRNYFLFLIIPLVLGTYSSTWSICNRQKTFEKNSFKQDHLYNNLLLNKVDMWFFLILSPIALLQASFLFFLYIKYKELRQGPGDIFIGSLFFECIYSMHILYESLYSLTQDTGMKNKSFACQTNSVLDVLGQYGAFFYGLAFFYYIREKLRSSFVPDKFGTWILHLSIMGISWVIVLIFVTYQLTGKTLDGTCAIQYWQVKGIASSLFFGSFFAVYIFIGVYAIIYLYKYSHKDKCLEKVSFEDLKFTQIYFLTYLILMCVKKICSIIGELNCEYTYEKNLLVFYTFNSVLQILAMIILPIVRCQEPYTKSCLLKIYRSYQSRINSSNEDDLQVFEMELSIPIVFTEDSPTQPKLQNEHDQSQSQIITQRLQTSFNSILTGNSSIQDSESSFNSNTLSKFQNNIRTKTMFNMICFINIGDQSKYHQMDGLEISNIKSETNIFEEKIIYSLQEDQIFNFIPNIPPQSFSEVMSDKKYIIRMISYAPIIFHSILTKEKEQIKLSQSLDVLINLPKIRQSGKNDGGKNGQFFFSSHDNKLMMKSVSQTELKILLKNLKEYYSHMLSDLDSKVAKIYGIFTFDGIIDHSIHLVLMKNITRSQKKSCILNKSEV